MVNKLGKFLFLMEGVLHFTKHIVSNYDKIAYFFVQYSNILSLAHYLPSHPPWFKLVIPPSSASSLYFSMLSNSTFSGLLKLFFMSYFFPTTQEISFFNIVYEVINIKCPLYVG